MEMGTMESALLLDHGGEAERTVNTLAAVLCRTGE
jgi:hypothetical protein